MQSPDLWYGTDGPPDADIVIVGEAWGSEEDKVKKPFIGQSGVELNRMLEEANIDRRKCLVTNVVAARPPDNEMWRFFDVAKDSKGSQTLRGLHPTPFVRGELARLQNQVLTYPRKLVIGTGNYALWACTSNSGYNTVTESQGRRVPSGIMDWRGSMWFCEPLPEGQFHTTSEEKARLNNTKFLPIMHPAAIMRAWYNRAPTVHDLKTRVPLALANDWRPNPQPVTLSPPTFSQAIARLDLWLNNANRGAKIRLANDIETIRRTFISCIGFADSRNFAMCIPFVRRDNPDGSFESYWSSSEEAQLVGRIRKVLAHPNIHIIGQNYIYDLQYIQYWLGVQPKLDHDTMLAQNVIFPGTPKDLSYLSSLYCRYHWYWKEDHKDWDKLGDLQRLLDYNCIDNLRTWEIDEAQRQYIKSTNQEPQMAFKMATSDLCLRMMNRGVLIDKNKRSDMILQLEEARNGFYRELLQIIPQDFVSPGHKTPWYRSDTQIKKLFYDILGFKVVMNRKTKRPTSGKEALMQLKKWYPEFSGLFNRLDSAGSVDNSLQVAQTPLEPNGRMQCSYNPGGTETHRLSSSKNVWGRGTNLQNLTKGEEDE